VGRRKGDKKAQKQTSEKKKRRKTAGRGRFNPYRTGREKRNRPGANVGTIRVLERPGPVSTLRDAIQGGRAEIRVSGVLFRSQKTSASGGRGRSGETALAVLHYLHRSRNQKKRGSAPSLPLSRMRLRGEEHSGVF